MDIIKMPLSEIRVPERNVRIHTEKQLKEFERSVKMFGQIRPIVVDEDNIILAGVGCFETLTRLNMETADVYKIEDLSENQKKKLMIADNKVYGLGIDDLDTFNSFLDELQNDLDIPGFDEDILKSMVAAADEVSERISEYGIIDDIEVSNIEAAKERKEALIDKAESQSIQSTVPNTPETNNQEKNTADIHKSIICPKCGEEIWL